VHPGKTWIQGSNPCVSAKQLANKRLSGRFFVAYCGYRDNTGASSVVLELRRAVGDWTAGGGFVHNAQFACYPKTVCIPRSGGCP
jgi:hypothetical protein